MVLKSIDGINLKLSIDHDFSWLKNYGTVFKIYDDKDSGNVLFRVEKENQRLFIKYAGAYTLQYNHDAQSAVKRLKLAALKYNDIKHQALIPLIKHENTGSGYALIFDWYDGECLHDHWMFETRVKYTGQKNYIELAKYQHKNSPMYRFKKLTLENRTAAYQTILDFTRTVHKAGYQAVDFNDNQVIYNFKNDTLKICDIDNFEKKPYTNSSNKLFANPERFRSPEEHIIGQICDEVTNVYHLGIFAFVIFGHEIDKTYSTWKASRKLYDFAFKAISPDRSKRFQTIDDMIIAFEEIINKGVK